MKPKYQQPVSITMRVTVSDDSFDSSLIFPVDGTTKEQINAMFLGWMNALEVVLKTVEPSTTLGSEEKER